MSAKRLIVCCDGTWQTLRNSQPTNVARMAQVIAPVAADGTPQVVFYDEGVGTRGGLDRFAGGAFGAGLDDNIREAYRFLALNYTDGDEILLFGFSRGAYTVRSLAGMIYASGLVRRPALRALPQALELYRDREVRPGDDEAVRFRARTARRVEIAFLGCWDTVGALGVPDLIPFLPTDDLARDRYAFHDTRLNRTIARARHAVAIDERRRPFAVTPMTAHAAVPGQLVERWFPGDHAAVGGGEHATRGLADGALAWMIAEAAAAGLAIDDDLCAEALRADPTVPCDAEPGFPFSMLGAAPRRLPDGVAPGDLLDPSVAARWQALGDAYRPANLAAYAGYLDSAAVA